MNSELLGLFAKYMEKQEVLSKLTESEELHGYNYSEIWSFQMSQEFHRLCI